MKRKPSDLSVEVIIDPESVTRRAERRSKGGRPSALTEAVTRDVVAEVGGGLSIDAAAHYLFIAPTTVRGWMQRGQVAADALDKGELTPERRAAEAKYLGFYLAVRHAEAIFERSMVKTVYEAAKSRAESALVLLERTRPNRWGRRHNPSVPKDSRPRGGLTSKSLDKFAAAVGLKTDQAPQASSKAGDSPESERSH